jgi:formylglycine-generating enzyme required for sulfatase activity
MVQRLRNEVTQGLHALVATLRVAYRVREGLCRVSMTGGVRMENKKGFSRRALLCGAGVIAVASVDAQSGSEYGVSALLDGSAMVKLPSGEFTMGSSDGNFDERPVHRVRISQPFEMSKCEVTQAQWLSVMTDAHAAPDAVLKVNGAVISNRPSHFKGASLPVEGVSWEDISIFLRRLNARDSGHLWRLPTEAEWEYACRAGSAKERDLAETAWYKGNSGDQTHPVATKLPNAWGLYDMQGNVLEWVHDWYSPDYYENSPATDPKGPENGSYRVFRGSCWNTSSENFRPSVRGFDFPVSRFDYVGFRLVRTLR